MITSNDIMKKIETLLEENGIELEVSGCGCCGSPWFSMKYKNFKCDNEDGFSIETRYFKEKELARQKAEQEKRKAREKEPKVLFKVPLDDRLNF